MKGIKIASIVLAAFVPNFCQGQDVPPSAQNQPSALAASPFIQCDSPYTGQIGTKLKFACQFKNATGQLTQHLKLSSPQTVKFDPETLDLAPGKTASFTAIVTDTSTGLASIIVGEGDLGNEYVIDMGFKGHLEVTETTPLDFRS